jgi:hypothetical protein
MRRPTQVLVAIGLLCAALAAPAASGDGGPGPGVLQGWDGVARGDVRYVAIPTGDHTVLQMIRRNTGRVERWILLEGSFGIPLVAYDGTTDGLSRDGRTLVLGDVNSSPQLTTNSTFAVVEVGKFRLRSTIRLRGDFTFDALSPGARMMYLSERLSAQDVLKYRVRAYDLGAKRLLPGVVVDKRSRESEMQGMPFARASSSDGRWAYTLYGGGPHPFVHALNTGGGGAFCIDLPHAWSDTDVSAMRLRLRSGQRLLVQHRRGGRPLAVLDVAKFRVVSAVRNP